MTKVSIWQLAEDTLAYGKLSGRYILVTPDGEDEVSDLTFPNAEAAAHFAASRGWTIVPLISGE